MAHRQNDGARGLALACAVFVVLAVGWPACVQSQKVRGITLSTHTNGSDWVTGDIEATLQEIWKLAVDGSPVTQSVVHPTNVTTEFEMVG